MFKTRIIVSFIALLIIVTVVTAKVHNPSISLSNHTIINHTSTSPLPIDLPIIAQWHFDEGVGNITTDSSGNGNTGTLQNGVQWTNNSISGNALSFDGIDDLVSTIHTQSIDVTKEIEIEAWVKHTRQGYGTIVSKNGPYILAIYNNKVHGGVYTNGWTEIDGTTNLQLGVWYKLKMKYDGSTVKVFVNDIEENSAPKIGQMPVVSQNLHIGWGAPGQNHFFHGIIDEITISGY